MPEAVSCPVPPEQRPLEEFQQLCESWFFSWPAGQDPRLSQRLVDDFIRPTLLVGLFKPPEELSAAVAMELLYFYALAHQARAVRGPSEALI